MQRTLSRHAQQSVHACVRVCVCVCVCVQPTLNNLLENREIGLPDGRWVSQAAAAFPVSIRHTTTTATTTTMQLGLRRSGFWCPRDGTTACSRFEHHALHSLPAPDRPLPCPVSLIRAAAPAHAGVSSLCVRLVRRLRTPLISLPGARRGGGQGVAARARPPELPRDRPRASGPLLPRSSHAARCAQRHDIPRGTVSHVGGTGPPFRPLARQESVGHRRRVVVGAAACVGHSAHRRAAWTAAQAFL